jgi:hypothetical protein
MELIALLIWFCIYLIVFCIIGGIIWLVLNYLPIPEPFRMAIRWVVAGILAIILLLLLLKMLVPALPGL